MELCRRCRRSCGAARCSTPASVARRQRRRGANGARRRAALLAAADGAGEPVDRRSTSPPRRARCSRSATRRLAAVAVTERFVLASLMVFDMRAALRDLAAGTAAAPLRGA